MTGVIVPAHYITHVAATLNGKTVLDAQWGCGISGNACLAFKIKGAKAGDKVKGSWTDYKGASRTDEATVS